MLSEIEHWWWDIVHMGCMQSFGGRLDIVKNTFTSGALLHLRLLEERGLNHSALYPLASPLLACQS